MSQPWRFSIAGLLWATFWSAVLVCLALAMWRLHQHQSPGWPPEKLGKQIFLTVGLGIALGGWIGGFRRPGMGMLIGGASAAAATVLWLACRLAWGILTVPIY